MTAICLIDSASILLRLRFDDSSKITEKSVDKHAVYLIVQEPDVETWGESKLTFQALPSLLPRLGTL